MMVLAGIAFSAGALMMLSMAMDSRDGSGMSWRLLLPMTAIAAALFVYGMASVRRKSD